MEYDAQLKLQAYLDGELPEAEAREVAKWLATDREPVALLGELRNTRQALVGLEVGVTLTETREFFWSKVEREIRRRQPAQPISRPEPFWLAWRKFLLPAGAIASVALAVLFVMFGSSPVVSVQTAIADPGAFTYQDFSSGTTLVWFSYPADSETAQNSPAGAFE